MRDDEGKSPLNRVIENVHSEGFPEVAHYLMNFGCDIDGEILTKLLLGACRRGKLDIVKELVDRHKLDPNSEFQ